MSGYRHVETKRLRLDAVQADDVDDLFALHSDPALWRHFPSGRHAERATTEAWVAGQEWAWPAHGLGYWVARPRMEEAGSASDLPSVVGVGGCTVRFGRVWNVYYRLARAAWGRGLASEMVVAALAAAEEVDPQMPVVAYLLEHNRESRGAAERAGLSLAWRGPDHGNPDPSAVRLVYADRALGSDLLDVLVRNK